MTRPRISPEEPQKRPLTPVDRFTVPVQALDRYEDDTRPTREPMRRAACRHMRRGK